MSIDLTDPQALPCPFCGAAAVSVTGVSGRTLWTCPVGHTLSALLPQWNTRAEAERLRAPKQDVEVMKRWISEAMDYLTHDDDCAVCDPPNLAPCSCRYADLKREGRALAAGAARPVDWEALADSIVCILDEPIRETIEVPPEIRAAVQRIKTRYSALKRTNTFSESFRIAAREEIASWLRRHIGGEP